MPTNRRNLIVAFGGIAAGTAFATGAFTSAAADRTVSVQVADDTNAMLGLSPAPEGAEYVEITDGTAAIDISGTSAGGQGVNGNAITVFDRLIEVTNNGTTRVTVGFIDDLVVERDAYDSNPTGWSYAGNGDAYVTLWGPYSGGIAESDKMGPENLTTTGFASAPSNYSGLVNDIYSYGFEDESQRTAAPGESLYLGGIVDTREDTLDDPGPPAQLDDTVTLSAEQY